MKSFSYEERPVRFLEIWSMGNWRLKAYGIAYDKARPDPLLIDAAQNISKARLEQISGSMQHYHVGFVGIHDGKTANFVFVDWWADENELHHHVYVSPKETPGELTYKTPTGLSACVWDIQIICYERAAWLKTVMQAEQPDFDRYLQQIYRKPEGI